MTNRQNPPAECGDSVIQNSSENGRYRYTPPVLHVYGSVSVLTAGGPGTGIDGPQTTMNVSSDRLIKEHIVRVGTHPLGISLYIFDYKSAYRQRLGAGRQFGVMADEVEQVMPHAVSVGPDGYKRVDYAMLGIRRHLQ